MIRFNKNYFSSDKRFKPKIKTQFFKILQQDKQLFLLKEIKCNNCNMEIIKKRIGKWVGKCEMCGNIFNFFMPLPIQHLIMQLDHREIVNMGGFGSGKTLGSCFLIAHMLRTVNNITVFAFSKTLLQLKNTGMKELKKFFLDEEFIKCTEEKWVLDNGSSVNWLPSGDEGKIRGVNAGIVWIIEASEIKFEVYKQLLTRLRQDELKAWRRDKHGNIIQEKNDNGVYKNSLIKDRTLMLIESNPDIGWVRDKVLSSHTIIHTQSVRGMKYVKKYANPIKNSKVKEISDTVSILQASVDSNWMSDTFIEEQKANASNKNEYEKGIYCDISFKSGLVFSEEIINGDFDIPSNQEHNITINGVNSFNLTNV